MTKNPTTHRNYARRSRRIRMTTQTDEQSAATRAQILTSAALQKALLEAEAETEYASRAAKRHIPTKPFSPHSGLEDGTRRA